MTSMLCHASDSQLLVIDIQTRLTAAMKTDDRERVIHNSGVLLQAAGKLGLPTLASEQYPKGLGHTEGALVEHFTEQLAKVEKTSFACSGEPLFKNAVAKYPNRQIIICGMESHVCVLQSALELLAGGYDVYVVEDAICSRSSRHHENAVARMRQAGVIITNTESVLFEWLRDAKHEQFKALSALIK